MLGERLTQNAIFKNQGVPPSTASRAIFGDDKNPRAQPHTSLWACVVSNIAETPKLLRLPALARELGVSPFFVRTMKRAGFAMPGNVALRDWALDWLRANPSFHPSAYQRAGACQGAPRRALTVSNTRHSRPLRHGRHTTLSAPLTRRSARAVLRQ